MKVFTRSLVAFTAGLLLGACASSPTGVPSMQQPDAGQPDMANADATQNDALDAIADDFVRLTLEIGEREPGYVDAYYGPAPWADEAKANARTVAELRAATTALAGRVRAVDAASLAPIERRRREFLLAQLRSADTRLRMLSGEKLSFDDEAEGLFGVRPQLQPLPDYDAALADLEAMLPGDGPLWQRVDAQANRAIIPEDKLDAVMRAAIAECRRRTARHIKLPANESFTLEFVTDQPWSGYNWYKGNATSLIQINTDLPVTMSRAVDLGCHEGYPGHHVLNMLLEQRLSEQRGWNEFTVYPLYSPQSFIAEGTANYGIELAFDDTERLAFERDVLYPLAGLDPSLAASDQQLRMARGKLGGARFTIAREYLDGRIDRNTAIQLAQKYQLLSPKRAEQSIAFTEKYRSYVINYGLGMDTARAYIEAAGNSDAERWAAMERVLSEPTLPSDLDTAHP